MRISIYFSCTSDQDGWGDKRLVAKPDLNFSQGLVGTQSMHAKNIALGVGLRNNSYILDSVGLVLRYS